MRSFCVIKEFQIDAPASIALCDGVSRARMACVNVNFDAEEGDIPEIVYKSGTLVSNYIDMEPV